MMIFRLVFMFLFTTSFVFSIQPIFYGEVGTKFERKTDYPNIHLSNFSSIGRLGFKGNFADKISFNGRILFAANSSPNFPYSSFQNDFTNPAIATDLAYFKWMPYENFEWFFGKHEFPFIKTSLLWDENVNPSGSSQIVNYKENNLKLAFGEYVLQGINHGSIPYLLAIQPSWFWNPSQNWSFHIATSAYLFKVKAQDNSLYSLPENRFSQIDPMILDVFGKIKFPYELNLYWEMSYNLRSRKFSEIGGTSTETALPVGLFFGAQYGSLKTAYDWMTSIEYAHKGIAAFPGSLTWTAFDSPLDKKGIHLEVGFALEDNLYFTVKNSLLYDADGKDELGNKLTNANTKSYRLAADLNLMF